MVGEMWMMSLDEVSATNKALCLQMEELRETLARSESQNQELLKAKQLMKEQQKVLQERADHYKNTMHRSLEDITRRLDHTNTEIHQSELQKRYLMKHNEELDEEMHEVTSQVASFKDGEAASEKDLEEMHGLVSEAEKVIRSMEDDLAETEHNFLLEKSHSSQLKEKVIALQRLRETRRNRVKDLQEDQELCLQQAIFLKMAQEDQMPKGWLLPEIAEAKLREVAGSSSKTRKILDWWWVAAKILFMLLFGCFLFLGLVLAYTRFCNPYFIAEMLLVVLSHQHLEELTCTLSPYLDFRSDGLLPF
ncbi:transmembrane protein 191C-like isoform X2 [Crotalus tigris]|nr:transmembrane protein 191C-like isoform X2 [Crotalus tigris]